MSEETLHFIAKVIDEIEISEKAPVDLNDVIEPISTLAKRKLEMIDRKKVIVFLNDPGNFDDTLEHEHLDAPHDVFSATLEVLIPFGEAINDEVYDHLSKEKSLLLISHYDLLENPLSKRPLILLKFLQNAMSCTDDSPVLPIKLLEVVKKLRLKKLDNIEVTNYLEEIDHKLKELIRTGTGNFMEDYRTLNRTIHLLKTNRDPYVYEIERTMKTYDIEGHLRKHGTFYSKAIDLTPALSVLKNEEIPLSTKMISLTWNFEGKKLIFQTLKIIASHSMSHQITMRLIRCPTPML